MLMTLKNFSKPSQELHVNEELREMANDRVTPWML